MDLLSAGIITVVSFVLVISFVVVIHELGHYWAGRWFGVHADSFSIGFGPSLVSRTDRNGTVWRIAALPLGGYVMFRGDRNAASAPDREALERLRRENEHADTTLHFKPVWQRAIIIAAGPIANFLLAIVLFTTVGLLRGEFEQPVQVSFVADSSAASAAGFEVGDVVLAMDGTASQNAAQITQYVSLRANQSIDFTVQRGDDLVTLRAVPREQMVPDGFGGERPLGRIGVGFDPNAPRNYICCTLVEAPLYGLSQTWETSTTLIQFMGRLLTGKASLELLNGVLGVATTSGQVANAIVAAPPSEAASQSFVATQLERAGRLFTAFVLLSAFLSVTLGLMNLLPIPVLDGGHLVYYAYEAITQRPPSAALQEAGLKVGLLLLVGTMVLATWNDLSYLRGLFS